MKNEMRYVEPDSQHPNTVGFIPPEKVRTASFVLMTLLILTGVGGGILMVWDLATEDTFWRLMASIGLIAGGVCAFTIVNTLFGKRSETAPAS